MATAGVISHQDKSTLLSEAMDDDSVIEDGARSRGYEPARRRYSVKLINRRPKTI